MVVITDIRGVVDFKILYSDEISSYDEPVEDGGALCLESDGKP